MSGIFVEAHAINDILSDYVSRIKKFQDNVRLKEFEKIK